MTSIELFVLHNNTWNDLTVCNIIDIKWIC